MRITDLYTDHLVNPIGYDLKNPVFSWKVTEAPGQRTASARVRIASDPAMQDVVYDSGERNDLDSLAFCPDYSFEPRRRYYWTAAVTDDSGAHAESEPAYFEPGDGVIRGRWIRAPFDRKKHAMFQKNFTVPEEGTAGKVARAELRITGLGLFVAYLNGKKVGNEYLAPFYNDYNHWMQVCVYDVTDEIQKGENALGILLGNGWYKGRFGFIDRLDCLYGDTQELCCELTVIFADGSEQVISSDESFLCHASPYLSSSIYDGEVYDSRLEVPGFGTAACSLDRNSEGGWAAAVPAEDFTNRLHARLSLPLVIHEKLKPEKVIHTPAGETVLDFGQEVTGLIRLHVREKEGTKVFLQFGELLQEGCFYNENLRTAKEELTFYANGKDQDYESRFTFYGFRYVKVTGVSEVNPEDLTAEVLHSDTKRTGSIVTSNPKVNRLFLNALWGQKGNFVDTPTDCPQRDERMGWTGDAQAFSATASFNMYTPAFYRKFMHDMLTEQQESDIGGSAPSVVPDILGQINRILDRKAIAEGKKPEEHTKPNGSCGWADAATIIPWTEYVFFGDRRLLEEQYENMKEWVDWIRRVDLEQCGGKHLWTTGFHYGDWLALDNFHQGSSFGGTDNYYVASAFYLYSSELTAKAAAVLGKKEDAEKYRKYAEEVRDAMRREYFTPTGRIAVDTQTAMVMALHFNIVPEWDRKRIVQDLKEKLDQENIHLNTGFIGTSYLCETLVENGLTDYAYTLLLNEDFPSWLYEVNMGATTIWERWNSVLPDGRVSDTGMNSMNHYAYGSIVEWMYRTMGGINPSEEKPGFRAFRLAPQPDDRFERCSVRFDSPMGMIESSWKKTDNGWNFSLEVPFDTCAEFRAPSRYSRADKEHVGKTVIRKNGNLIAALRPGESVELCAGKYEAQLEG